MKAAVFLIVATLLCGSCINKPDIPLEFPTPPPREEVALKPLAPLNLKHDSELEAEIAKIAENAKGRVGVSAVLLETGQAAELNAQEQFPMQSVYKLPIAM